MKNRNRIGVGMLWAALTFSAAAQASDNNFTIAFADSKWDGNTVPDGHQCHRQGGTEGSPVWDIAGIPDAANYLVFAYSDRNYAPADNGGHGVLAYEIKDVGSPSVEVPSVPAHSFELPANFTSVRKHVAEFWDLAGAYLPPCSGGRGNEYYVTVTAVSVTGDWQSSDEFNQAIEMAVEQSPLASAVQVLAYY